MVNVALNPNFTNVKSGVRDLAQNVKSHATVDYLLRDKTVVETVLKTSDDKWWLCWCCAPADKTIIGGVENPCFFMEMASDEMTETSRARREVREGV